MFRMDWDTWGTVFQTGFCFVALTDLELCRPGWLITHRDPYASVSQMLGFKTHITIAGIRWIFLQVKLFYLEMNAEQIGNMSFMNQESF